MYSIYGLDKYTEFQADTVFGSKFLLLYHKHKELLRLDREETIQLRNFLQSFIEDDI